MGAVTVVIRKRTGILGIGTARLCDITFSGTYGAGGDTFTAAQFELGTIDGIIPLGPAVASATTGLDVMPDLVNKKLRLMGGAASGVAGAESAVANQAATVARVLVFGDNPNV